MIHSPGGAPDRLRSSRARKVGRPGALAASGAEGAEVMDQRVSAALGAGSALARTSRPRVDPLRAAIINLRLAVRP